MHVPGDFHLEAGGGEGCSALLFFFLFKVVRTLDTRDGWIGPCHVRGPCGGVPSAGRVDWDRFAHQLSRSPRRAGLRVLCDDVPHRNSGGAPQSAHCLGHVQDFRRRRR